MSTGYRKGVRLGNYVEDLAVEGDTGHGNRNSGSFTATTTARETYGVTKGKTGQDLLAASKREDIELKYGKYGKLHTSPGTKEGGFFATTSQLVFANTLNAQRCSPKAGAPLSAAQHGAAATVAPQDSRVPVHARTVQQCLWSGSKFKDSKVPKTLGEKQLAAARQEKLAQEASRDVYCTVEKEALGAAAEDENRAGARPPACRPKAEGGQEAQVGRKAVGDFCKHLDRDYHRIGLRR